MNTLQNKPLAKNLAFDDELMWVDLTDGRKIGIPLAYFPRLLSASPKQRKSYVISGGGQGLHWEGLNEDISVEHLLMGFGDRVANSFHAKQDESQPGI